MHPFMDKSIALRKYKKLILLLSRAKLQKKNPGLSRGIY